jgi:hypothetical protein
MLQPLSRRIPELEPYLRTNEQRLKNAASYRDSSAAYGGGGDSSAYVNTEGSQYTSPSPAKKPRGY